MEIRRSGDRLISTMGLPILVRWHLILNQAPGRYRTALSASFGNANYEYFKRRIIQRAQRAGIDPAHIELIYCICIFIVFNTEQVLIRRKSPFRHGDTRFSHSVMYPPLTEIPITPHNLPTKVRHGSWLRNPVSFLHYRTLCNTAYCAEV